MVALLSILPDLSSGLKNNANASDRVNNILTEIIDMQPEIENIFLNNPEIKAISEYAQKIDALKDYDANIEKLTDSDCMLSINIMYAYLLFLHT